MLCLTLDVKLTPLFVVSATACSPRQYRCCEETPTRQRRSTSESYSRRRRSSASSSSCGLTSARGYTRHVPVNLSNASGGELGCDNYARSRNTLDISLQTRMFRDGYLRRNGITLAGTDSAADLSSLWLIHYLPQTRQSYRSALSSFSVAESPTSSGVARRWAYIYSVDECVVVVVQSVPVLTF